MTNNAESHTQPALWEAPEELTEPVTRAARKAGRQMMARDRPMAPMEFSELWTIEEVANYLGVPKQTIYCWRTSGYGPKGFRVGKHLRWRTATVIAWTVAMERQQGSSSDRVPGVAPRSTRCHRGRLARPRRWCSPRSRRAASEERRAAANGAIAVEHVPLEVSLDEHVRAVLDSPAACRRVLRDLRQRAEAGLLGDGRWNSVQSEVERFQSTPRPGLRWGAR